MSRVLGLEHASSLVHLVFLHVLSDLGGPALAHELLRREGLLTAVARRREVALALYSVITCTRYLLFGVVQLSAGRRWTWPQRRCSRSLVVAPFVARGVTRVDLVVRAEGSVGLVVHSPVVARCATKAQVTTGLLGLCHHPVVFLIFLV